ncbi:MAG: ABC transporter ATP-binding protein [Gammaproteobacteria bacterium]|nr:ABC transporter ATP-binding protein [Gammaproteobacteria bacterium]MDE0248292.1 ABC transporter ATP-binding protein [Gammaproteobacteria bacterium]
MATEVAGPIQEEEALGKAYDGVLMRRLLRYLEPYRWQVVPAVALLVSLAGMQIVGPWLVQIALDEAVPAADGRLVALLAIAYMASAIVAFGLEYGQMLVTTWLGQSVMRDLRREIFGHLQRLDLGFYDRNPVGRLMTRITSDVETLNNLFSSGVVAIFGDLVTLLFVVSAMLVMDWRLALVTFSVLPFVAWAAIVFRTRIRVAYRDIRIRMARINAFLHERITGIRVVQLFNREEPDARRLEKINDDYLEAHLRSITYYALFFPIVELFTAIALALIISYGGLSILGGTTTVGVVAAFLLYARRFFRPIQDLSDKYNLLQAAMASSERIFGLLDQEPRVRDPRGSRRRLPDPVRGEIEFRNVWFSYAREKDTGPEWVLKDLSFRVAPGEKLAIVGHTGAGKTTVISLLMRFYDPQRGEILLDGIPIRSVPQRELRSAIGLVLQDIFLFSEDVAYNIGLGNPAITPERVREAAYEVGAARVIERLPDGLGQPLGERGRSLSVGERQLLSFARALAFDPRVLVLDEATSSVDSELEAQIEEATTRLMAGRTSLVIAHRLSTIQGADRIMVLHLGELAEEGSHGELLGKGGLYARLHELQFAAASAGV